MTSNMDMVEFRFQSYRRLRRGLVSLPVMEEQLVADLQLLAGVLNRGNASQLEPFYLGQILTSAKELADETVASLLVLRQYFDSDPFFADVDAMKKVAATHLKDKELLSLVIATLESSDGIQNLLKTENARLELKQKLYASAFAMLRGDDIKAAVSCIDFFLRNRASEVVRVRAAIGNNEKIFRDGALAELIMNRLFQQITSPMSGAAYSGTVTDANVGNDPLVLKKWPVVIAIAVGCALLCAS